MSHDLATVDHIGYTVSDLDRSVEFYAFLLEREPTARKTWDVEYIGRIQGGKALFRSDAPVRIEWGPYEGGHAARVRDPDGITIELIQLPPGGVRL